MYKFLIIPFFIGLFLVGCSDYSSNSSSYGSSSSSSSSSSYGSSVSTQEMTACTYAQIEIENKLKSPSSAEHQACRYNTYTSLGNDKYVVESYVDAENAYGATVRTDYKCTVTLTGSDVYYINCSIL